jgi:hypothetical protein
VNSFDLLGITFDRSFTVRPYLHSLAREARFRAGRVALLAKHLPRGQLLRQLGSGLLMGKVAHCLPVVARPRLPGSTAVISEALAQVQVAVNDVARSVVGCKREDHITIVDLLEAATFLSLIKQVVKATAMSAWTAFHSCDGSNRASDMSARQCSAVPTCLRQERQGQPRQGRSGSGQGGWTHRCCTA